MMVERAKRAMCGLPGEVETCYRQWAPREAQKYRADYNIQQDFRLTKLERGYQRSISLRGASGATGHGPACNIPNLSVVL